MQLAGRAYIKVNGKLLRSQNGAKLNPGGVSRNAVIGDNAVHGYTEKTEAPSVECTVSHAADTDVTALGKITGATVTFETDNGVTYTLREAWVVEPPEFTANDNAEVSLKFEAINCERV